jgi:hypothetical protein
MGRAVHSPTTAATKRLAAASPRPIAQQLCDCWNRRIMQNLVENYRLALAKRRAARRAEAKAHKHRRRELQMADYRAKLMADIAREDQMWREQVQRENERNELAGLINFARYPAE